ncbi:MAG TPA: lipid-A-disaccharide synthase [Thermoanaerobaculia bacterium]|nr:lipid-A-disaccharide synthase [Thermoanaerobaculia bacterium]
MDGGVDLLMVAGEASGDLHGGRLLAALRGKLPGLRPFGLGGDTMQAAGLEAVAHSREVAVVGIAEALKVLPRARQVFAALLAEVERRRARAAVLVDFPEFNLRLARELKRRGLRVVYYISPQVWAWRRRRVETVAEVVDEMLVLFPFEADFYRRAGVEVIHVGHPLVDEVPRLPQAWDEGLPEGEPYRVALLPGSRPSEVEPLLPRMLEAVRRLASTLPVEARVIQAPTIPRELLEEGIALSGLPVRIVAEDRFAAIAGSHLALCASGTATLEVGLLETPLIVLYHLKLTSYLLGRLLVRLPWFSLVNLVLGRKVVPELIQAGASPARVARAAARLLGDPEAIAAMRRGLGELRERLGQAGATERAATEVVAALVRAGVLPSPPGTVTWPQAAAAPEVAS